MNYIAQGNKYLREGSLERAIEQYQMCITVNPKFAWAYFKLGEALHEKGVYDAANIAFEQAIEINPKLREYLVDFINIKPKTNEPQEIKHSYEDKFISLNSIDSMMNEVNPSLREFIDLSCRFWSNIDCNPTKQYIVIDLIHDFKVFIYMYGILVLAKYMQKIYGYKIIAVIGTMDANMLELARAFGVEIIVPVDKFFSNINTSLAAYEKYITKKEKENVDWISQIINNCDNYKLLITKISINDLHIGDLIYDTYLRKESLGTIKNIKNVEKYIFQAVYFLNIYNTIFNKYDVKFVICGHTVYNHWGILARAASNNKIPVLFQGAGWGTMAVRRYDNLDELYDHETKIPTDTFETCFNRDREQLVKVGIDLLKNKFYNDNLISPNLIANARVNLSNAYLPTLKVYDRAELCQLLNIDCNKPIVAIMSHVFSDAPHSFRHRIFVDYYEWLLETLKICSEVNSVNWVVKDHPHLLTFYKNLKDTARSLIENNFSFFRHIKWLPNDINNICLFDSIKAVITVSGTIGIEAATFGIPSILAGSSSYSELGFTYNAQTIEEYRKLLINVPQMKKLTKEQIDKAYAAYSMVNYYSIVKASLLPEDSANQIEDVTNKLKKPWNIRSDALFRNLCIQLAIKDKHLFKYNELFAL